MLEGLPGHEIAYVAKIHHAIADGLASSTLLHLVMDPADGESPVTPFPAQAREAQALPTKRKLALQAIRETPQRVANLPNLMMRTMKGAQRLIQYHRQRSEYHWAIRNRTNGPQFISWSKRSFATVTMDSSAFVESSTF